MAWQSSASIIADWFAEVAFAQADTDDDRLSSTRSG